eukprot:11733180-Alexandrium_andersonii.AAC.1
MRSMQANTQGLPGGARMGGRRTRPSRGRAKYRLARSTSCSNLARGAPAGARWARRDGSKRRRAGARGVWPGSRAKQRPRQRTRMVLGQPPWPGGE